MDPQVKDAIAALVYSAGAATSIYYIAKFSYLKRVSNNETYETRVKADIEREQKMTELQERKLKLMDSAEFQAYHARRDQALEKLRQDNPNYTTWLDIYIKEYLDAIVGESPLE